MKLSIILPSYKEPYLKKTVESLLENSELPMAELEIICVCDGYYPNAEQIVDDHRVKYLHLGANRGMRGAINAGISISTGEFFMRLDAHCKFGKGYDRIMTESCLPNQIMTARRYYLDPIKWEVMGEDYVDYEKLVIQDMGNGVRKFAGQKWNSRTKERQDIMIDETMAMQGSMWCCPRKWFDEVCGGELQQEGYGPAYQDSTEVTMKTWKAGGKLMVNKNTWFAHKHRSFARTHNEGTIENPWNKESSWAYALSVWEDYYLNTIKELWKI